MNVNTYDAAVVGLGAMGSAALYQLSKMGLKVIGIDRYAPPHTFGSSHGESRVTRQAIGEGLHYTPMVLRANEIWTELEALSGEKLYEHCGMLIAARKEQRFLQNTLKAAQNYDIKHDLLAGSEVEARFPALNVADKDHVFYYEPDSGYLHPERCISTQIQSAERNGVEVRRDIEIVDILENRSGTVLSAADGTKIYADKTIVATGSWIRELLKDMPLPPLKTLLQTQYWFEVEPSYSDMLSLGHVPVFLCGDEKSETTRSFYGFPMMNGSSGGMKFAVHETDREVLPKDKDSADPVTKASEIYKIISQYIRGIRPMSIRAVNCLYTVTPDEDFIIDRVPGKDNIVFASACSGHGFKHSAAVGEVLAELATSNETTLDIEAFRLERFTKA